MDGELVCHVAVAPFFTGKAYRATRLVVMPEWQGAGAGTKFLEWVCNYHKDGHGRCGKRLPTIFHTSHPQLIGYLKSSPKWVLKSQQLYGGNKAKCAASIKKANRTKNNIATCSSGIGYGGHFRAVQGYKYIGDKTKKQ